MAKRKLNKKKNKIRSAMGRKAGRVKKLKKLMPKEDKFWDEDAPVVVEDTFVSQPSHVEVNEVLSDLDGYRDWARESRGNGLTFGDY